MLPESQAAVVARNETWTGQAATEPYEAGWAREAIVFVRALKAAGAAGRAHVELSPDGMNWAAEGTHVRAAGRQQQGHLRPGRAVRQLAAHSRRAAAGQLGHRRRDDPRQGVIAHSRSSSQFEIVLIGSAHDLKSF